MKQTRRKHMAAFKAKVVLAALKGELMVERDLLSRKPGR